MYGVEETGVVALSGSGDNSADAETMTECARISANLKAGSFDWLLSRRCACKRIVF